MHPIVTDTNYANKAVFTNLTPVNGTLVINLHRPNTSTYHYINGFVITELGDSSALFNKTLTSAGNIGSDSWVKAGWQGSPNPFRNYIVVGAIFEKAQAQLTVKVTDIAGRVVYTRSFSNIPAGPWQQRLELSGKVQQRGIYLVQVTGPSLTRPVTLRLLKDQ